MAVSHRLLTPVLFLLPFVMQVLAQQPGCSVKNNRPSVYENNPIGYVVTTVDVQPDFVAEIDPTFPDASFFTLQGTELQLKQVVDYEKENLLLVYLKCYSTTGQSDSLQIIVTILNLNDNTPVFKETNHTEVVPEDTKVNATIIAREHLSASDDDLDIIFYELATVVPLLEEEPPLQKVNIGLVRTGQSTFIHAAWRQTSSAKGIFGKAKGRLRFATVPDTDSYFAIKGVNNPEVYLLKALDYEKSKSMMLLLYARDRPVGSTDVTNTATATINILIEQADTKSPWFQPCNFINTEKSICISSPYTGRVNISEVSTEPLILQPGPIYALDPDYTLNEKIVYSIVGGNTDEVFSVNADTGNLTMNKAVTSPDSYLLQVMATQVNNIQKYSIVTVEIKVINKSEHPPYFENKIYNGTTSVGLAPKSFVFQAGDPSTPLMITAADDDFPDKVNPNIEYYIKNSTAFIATKDGLILTNVMLQSPETLVIEAVGKDTVSMQEASTVIKVDVVPAPDVASDKIYTVKDMAILGGTLAALLLIALIFLGVMIYKWYGKPVKYLIRKKFFKEISTGYYNQSYKQDKHPDVSNKQHQMTENGNVQLMTCVPEQPELSLPLSNAEVDIIPRTVIASPITFDQEEKEEEAAEAEEKAEHEKEVKSILKTDRHVADDGYKAVWFETDVDPDAGERVKVIEDNAADDDDDSDQDLKKVEEEEEEEEEDYDKDDHHRGLGVSFASESPSLPAAEVVVRMSDMDTVAEDNSV